MPDPIDLDAIRARNAERKRLLTESGLSPGNWRHAQGPLLPLIDDIDALLAEVERLRAAVLAEREACATIADTFECDGRPLDLVDLAADIAAAIRAREVE
jgi:hypothetical protein